MSREITPLDRRVLSITDAWTDKEFYMAFGFERIQMPRTISYETRFDASCSGWHKHPGYNQSLLVNQQAYAGTLLLKQGHLFLNEVLDLLTLPRTQLGATSGWTVDLMCEEVDFGLEKYPEFLNGHEQDVNLKFEVYENIHLRLSGV
jgi:hypothetical protein